MLSYLRFACFSYTYTSLSRGVGCIKVSSISYKLDAAQAVGHKLIRGRAERGGVGLGADLVPVADSSRGRRPC